MIQFIRDFLEVAFIACMFALPFIVEIIKGI